VALGKLAVATEQAGGAQSVPFHPEAYNPRRDPELTSAQASAGCPERRVKVGCCADPFTGSAFTLPPRYAQADPFHLAANTWALSAMVPYPAGKRLYACAQGWSLPDSSQAR